MQWPMHSAQYFAYHPIDWISRLESIDLNTKEKKSSHLFDLNWTQVCIPIKTWAHCVFEAMTSYCECEHRSGLNGTQRKEKLLLLWCSSGHKKKKKKIGALTTMSNEILLRSSFTLPYLLVHLFVRSFIQFAGWLDGWFVQFVLYLVFLQTSFLSITSSTSPSYLTAATLNTLGMSCVSRFLFLGLSECLCMCYEVSRERLINY